jgi:hypothetical protein
MDERDKIIHENYPVERLPQDLREGMGDGARVRVTIERADDGAKRAVWNEIRTHMNELHRSGALTPVTTEEAVRRVRELRDEWDR